MLVEHLSFFSPSVVKPVLVRPRGYRRVERYPFPGNVRS